MKSQRACTAASLLLGVPLFATTLAGSAFAQSASSSAAASGPASPWDQRVNADAVQADAWFQNYRFRNGGRSIGASTLSRGGLVVIQSFVKSDDKKIPLIADITLEGVPCGRQSVG